LHTEIVLSIEAPAMPAKRKTVPVTTGIHPSEFLIKNWPEIEDWPEIEKACKFKSMLPAAAPADLKEATRRFLLLQKMEAEAIPLADLKSDLFEIAKATEEFRLHLTPLRAAVGVSIPTDKQIDEGLKREKKQIKDDLIQEKIKKDLDRGFQIMHRLERCFNEVASSQPIKLGERRQFRNFAQEMKMLCESLASLEDAARKAAEATRDENAPQLKGDAWNRWIAEIYEIVTDAGLPATTSNDTDKRVDTETPFVRLVRELQKLLPNEARHKDRGLVKAIQRATEIYRRQRNNSQAAA
jgi:hypothetical protein